MTAPQPLLVPIIDEDIGKLNLPLDLSNIGFNAPNNILDYTSGIIGVAGGVAGAAGGAGGAAASASAAGGAAGGAARADLSPFFDSLQEVTWDGPNQRLSRSIDFLSSPTLNIGQSIICLSWFLGKGSYGIVFRGFFQAPGGQIIPVAIKFQVVKYSHENDIESNPKKSNFVKEVVIQHYINLASSRANHTDCSYAGQIYAVGRIDNQTIELSSTATRDAGVGVIVMELASTTLGEYFLTNILQPLVRTIGQQYCMLLSRKLYNLWNNFEFNHCDFHAENALIYDNHSIKLADFGFSRLLIRNTTQSIELKNKEYTFTKERDMAILLCHIYIYCITSIPFICHDASQSILHYVGSGSTSRNYLYDFLGLYGHPGTKLPLCEPENLLRSYNPMGDANEGALSCNQKVSQGLTISIPPLPSSPASPPSYVSPGGRRKTRSKKRGLKNRKMLKKRKTRKQRGGRSSSVVLPNMIASATRPVHTNGKIDPKPSKFNSMKYEQFGSSLENYFHWLRFVKRDANLESVLLDLFTKSPSEIRTGYDSKGGEPILRSDFHEPIISAYLKEADPEISYILLRFLLFGKFASKEDLEAYIQHYQTFGTREDRIHVIPSILYSAKFI